MGAPSKSATGKRRRKSAGTRFELEVDTETVPVVRLDDGRELHLPVGMAVDGLTHEGAGEPMNLFFDLRLDRGAYQFRDTRVSGVDGGTVSATAMAAIPWGLHRHMVVCDHFERIERALLDPIAAELAAADSVRGSAGVVLSGQVRDVLAAWSHALARAAGRVRPGEGLGPYWVERFAQRATTDADTDTAVYQRVHRLKRTGVILEGVSNA